MDRKKIARWIVIALAVIFILLFLTSGFIEVGCERDKIESYCLLYAWTSILIVVTPTLLVLVFLIVKILDWGEASKKEKKKMEKMLKD